MPCDVLEQEAATRLRLINIFLFVTLKNLNLLKNETENPKKMYLTVTADVNKPVTFYGRVLMNKKSEVFNEKKSSSFLYE